MKLFKRIEFRHALSLMTVYLITAVHHAYGAWLYQTPWRNHIVYQGFTWLLASYLMLLIYVWWKKIWIKWIYLLFSGFFFIGAIGFYEGLYNHLLKNLLWIIGINSGTLLRLYPPPKYELPNDFFFELTGILTIAACWWCLLVTFEFTRHRND